MQLRLFSCKNISQIFSKTFATHCFFTDCLNHTFKTFRRKHSANPCQSVYPKHHFVVFDKLKYEIRNFMISFLYWSWDRKHQNKWFSDFQNNWTLKFKFEVCFSFFILIWKTKNQIYLNKYLMKLTTIPLTQS